MKKISNARSFVLIAAFTAMAAVLTARLYRMQIVEGQEYSEDFTMKAKRTLRMKNVRGTIYDRNGKPLAYNELTQSVVFEDGQTYESGRERQLSLNGKIYRMLQIIEKNGDTPVNHLKIEVDEAGEYQFCVEGTQRARFRADIFGKAYIEDLEEEEKGATAEEIISYLSGEERFCLESSGGSAYSEEEKRSHGLPEILSQKERLQILSVRYALYLQSYQKYLSVVVAEDVSEETVASILENREELSGAGIEEDTVRVYEGGEP